MNGDTISLWNCWTFVLFALDILAMSEYAWTGFAMWTWTLCVCALYLLLGDIQFHLIAHNIIYWACSDYICQIGSTKLYTQKFLFPLSVYSIIIEKYKKHTLAIFSLWLYVIDWINNQFLFLQSLKVSSLRLEVYN